MVQSRAPSTQALRVRGIPLLHLHPRRRDTAAQLSEVAVEGMSRSEIMTLRVLFNAIGVESSGTTVLSEFDLKLIQVASSGTRAHELPGDSKPDECPPLPSPPVPTFPIAC